MYGLLCGCFSRLIHTRNRILNDVLALLCAMLGGRVVYGLVNALIFRAGEYSLALWWSASFVTALPGILLQLVILPPLAASLKKYRYR